jgi:hypothetical protein
MARERGKKTRPRRTVGARRKGVKDMKYIHLIFYLFILLLGAFLAVQSYIRSKRIFSGRERRYSIIVADSAFAGLSASLLFFGGVYFYAVITDSSYPTQINEFLLAFVLFLIPGFVIFLGSLWQYFQVGLFRDKLLEWLKKRGNNQS